ncbi:ABC transporter substrate-binding protein [Alloscardovia macacae]|uniref:ABC transporter substrate-binding protein n=1 Tax=Alloscardovia macacae TaxID=1160091 RepID=A0A261F651_9BIFI|nr:ABC transporter substrate-binding protein [Alloscardovia macacae]OZG54612.1 ABC transporter substrate-binding protein [Alloscardovia macacae]
MKKGYSGGSALPADKRAQLTRGTDDALNAQARARTGVRAAQTGRRIVQNVWWPMVSIVVALALLISAVVVAYARTGDGSHGVSGASGAGAHSHISIGLQLAPTNLDIRQTSGTALDQLLIGNVYEALLTRNEDNTVSPGLAQSWEVSADRLTYTFHLNAGMTFSNGDTLDASDVVWSIRSMMEGHLQGSNGVANFASVSAPDARTVVLKLSKPYSELLWNLSGRSGLVFDEQALSGADGSGADASGADGSGADRSGSAYDAKTQALGSGPYVLSAYEPGVSATLTARTKYWGEQALNRRAHIQTITVRYFADPQAGLNAFTSGDVQVLAPISGTLTGAIQNDARFTYKTGDGTDKYVLAFNNATGGGSAADGTAGVLKDKRVRQAIRYAIDENAIIASRGGTDAPLGGPIPSLDPGYEDLTGLYPTDVEKARTLLAEAGYSTSHPLRLRLMYANTYPAEIGQQLRSQLARVGIDLNVQRVEFATWLSTVYKQRDFDISMVDHNESHDFAQWANPEYYYGYDNADVQKLYAQAMEAVTDSERDSLLARAARLVSEDAAADWIMNYRVVTAWDKRVRGFPLTMNQVNMPLWNVTFGTESAGAAGSSVQGGAQTARAAGADTATAAAQGGVR